MSSPRGVSSLRGRPVVDMTGRSMFGDGLIVLRRSGNYGKLAGWIVRFASCGHEQHEIGSYLRERESRGKGVPSCRKCRDDARKAPPPATAPRAPRPRCSSCGAYGHLTTACTRAEKRQARASKPTRWCAACASLPHRRPKSGCPSCGGSYEPERLPTLDDVMALPSDDRRLA